MMHKEKLENFIVYKTMEILKNDSVIEELSTLLYNLQYNESTVLPQLEQQLKEREKEIENIVNVIQQGIASQALVKRLGELEASKNEISDAIIKEQIQSPTYTQDEYRMALTNYRKINITQQDGKRKIIDTFINAIYVFDDHLKIVYNGNNKEETVSLEALENSSTLFSSGAPKNMTSPEAAGSCFLYEQDLNFKKAGSVIKQSGRLFGSYQVRSRCDSNGKQCRLRSNMRPVRRTKR
ncbi:MAG: hypothetical protein E7614_01310 [Ruminococcaceae bacterium]|nr:hypothetical protein [Oscillospiraceae bacterium]